eukprot:14256955-Ditylum_brightwellii.AAC.1
MEMELEEKGDLKHQWTEVAKKKKQQKNNHTRKDPYTQKQQQNTNHSLLARASKYKPGVHIIMDNSDTLDQTAEKYSTVQEQMHKRGAKDMSKSITYKTPVMIAFEVIKPKE